MLRIRNRAKIVDRADFECAQMAAALQPHLSKKGVERVEPGVTSDLDIKPIRGQAGCCRSEMQQPLRCTACRFHTGTDRCGRAGST
jgi:hypothetical protein